MSITITDPGLLAQLAQSSGVVEFKDPDGRTLGTFTPEPFGKPPPGYLPPISEEEIARRRQLYQNGKPLAEILKRLQSAPTESGTF
jgi:hypothetical protein